MKESTVFNSRSGAVQEQSAPEISATRICSLLPGLTDIVAELGHASSVVASSHECEGCGVAVTVPKLPLSGDIDGSLSSREVHSGWRASHTTERGTFLRDGLDLTKRICSFYWVRMDKIAELRPSVVLTRLVSPSSPLEPSEDEVAEALKSTVPSVQTVLSVDPSTISEIFAAYRSIARALSCSQAASREVFKAKIGHQKVKRFVGSRALSKTEPSAADPTLGIVQWADPIYLAGGWVPEIVEIGGGGSDGFTRVGGPSVVVRPEDVLQLDIVVFAICAVDMTGCRRVIWRFLERNKDKLPSKMPRMIATDATKLFSRPSLATAVQSAEVVAEIVSGTNRFGQMGVLWCEV